MSYRNARWPVATLAVLLIACSSPGDGNDPDLGTGDPDLRDPLPGEGPCATLTEPAADATCPVTVRYVPSRSVRSVAIAGEWNG